MPRTFDGNVKKWEVYDFSNSGLVKCFLFTSLQPVEEIAIIAAFLFVDAELDGVAQILVSF